jgi:hypothetical protein
MDRPNSFHPFRTRFETALSAWKEQGPQKTRVAVPLAHDEWRYLVVELRDYSALPTMNSGLLQIHEASRIAGPELDLSIEFFRPKGFGFNHGSYHLSPIASSPRGPEEVQIVTDENIQALMQVIRQLEALRSSSEFEEINQSIELFVQYDSVRKQTTSRLNVLGSFAVLESLIAHDQKGADDSLGRQLRTKMQLLSRRFHSPIEFSQFGDANQDTIWNRLYECRSVIAHGSTLVFHGKSQILKNLDTVDRTMRAVVQQTLRHALFEPQLIMDLKHC